MMTRPAPGSDLSMSPVSTHFCRRAIFVIGELTATLRAPFIESAMAGQPNPRRPLYPMEYFILYTVDGWHHQWNWMEGGGQRGSSSRQMARWPLPLSAALSLLSLGRDVWHFYAQLVEATHFRRIDLSMSELRLKPYIQEQHCSLGLNEFGFQILYIFSTTPFIINFVEI